MREADATAVDRQLSMEGRPVDRRRGPLYRLHIDPFLLWGVLILSAIGLAVLYSATGQDLGATARQGARMLFGLGIMLVLARLAPRYFLMWAPWSYVAGLLLLCAVAIAGTGKGAQRWLDLKVVRFQPSEMMKIFVPMMVAWYLQKRPLPPRLRDLLAGAALVIVPTVLDRRTTRPRHRGRSSRRGGCPWCSCPG